MKNYEEKNRKELDEDVVEFMTPREIKQDIKDRQDLLEILQSYESDDIDFENTNDFLIHMQVCLNNEKVNIIKVFYILSILFIFPFGFIGMIFTSLVLTFGYNNDKYRRNSFANLLLYPAILFFTFNLNVYIGLISTITYIVSILLFVYSFKKYKNKLTRLLTIFLETIYKAKQQEAANN